MPLPKPPTKRADMLKADDFTSQPKPVKQAKSTTRSASAKAAPTMPQQPPVLELVKPAATVVEKVTAPQPASTKTGRAATIVADKSGSAPAATKASNGDGAKARNMPSPGSSTTRRRRDVGGPAKLFVLDTNVLLHDPMSLFRFEEHDVYLPMITLEELDGHKKGMTEVARNARQVSRDLDQLAADGTVGALPVSEYLPIIFAGASAYAATQHNDQNGVGVVSLKYQRADNSGEMRIDASTQPCKHRAQHEHDQFVSPGRDAKRLGEGFVVANGDHAPPRW